MASIVARRAFTTTVRRLEAAAQPELKKQGKKDPELIILGGIMVAAFGGAGLYFGRSPTSSTSEKTVPMAGMPWETGSESGKYRYHPGGDSSAAPKDAPSAVNVVVVPNVNLPKVRQQSHDISYLPYYTRSPADFFLVFSSSLQELHDKYNKWGKEGY
ncbi:hypothetical protein RB595_003225 [Gaeumannomyces hyphopodioides]